MVHFSLAAVLEEAAAEVHVLVHGLQEDLNHSKLALELLPEVVASEEGQHYVSFFLALHLDFLVSASRHLTDWLLGPRFFHVCELLKQLRPLVPALHDVGRDDDLGGGVHQLLIGEEFRYLEYLRYPKEPSSHSKHRNSILGSPSYKETKVCSPMLPNCNLMVQGENLSHRCPGSSNIVLGELQLSDVEVLCI